MEADLVACNKYGVTVRDDDEEVSGYLTHSLVSGALCYVINDVSTQIGIWYLSSHSCILDVIGITSASRSIALCLHTWITCDTISFCKALLVLLDFSGFLSILLFEKQAHSQPSLPLSLVNEVYYIIVPKYTSLESLIMSRDIMGR